jgi:hypothetical protein
MKHWWERYNGLIDGDIVRGGFTKDEIEDFTGRIPLFLDRCVVDGKVDLNITFFEDIYEQAIRHEQEIKLNCHKLDWPLYATLALPSQRR